MGGGVGSVAGTVWGEAKGALSGCGNGCGKTTFDRTARLDVVGGKGWPTV